MFKKFITLILLIGLCNVSYAGINLRRPIKVQNGMTYSNFSVVQGKVGRNDQDQAGFWMLPAGLSFLSCYQCLGAGTYPASDLMAKYAKGSRFATFTAARSATAPATYVDSNGIIQLVTTANVARIQGGYYDATGFVKQPANGIMMEAAGTNLIPRTDGTASGSGLWTGWTDGGSKTGTVTKTQVNASNIIGISGSNWQRYQYTGVAGDTNKSAEITISSAAASVAPNNVVTASCILSTQTTSAVGTGNLVIQISWRDNTGALISATSSSDLKSSISSTPKLFTVTGTAPALTDRVIFKVSVSSGVDEGDTIDFQVCRPQVEISPYATSFIPTTTAALTRPAETLKYENANNRTAAQESIAIKFTPESTFANNGVDRFLLSSETKDRQITKTTTGTSFANIKPNNTDSTNCSTTSTTNFLLNTSYLLGISLKHSSPYVKAYVNGSANGTPETTDDFTDNAWGTYFFLGSADPAVVTDGTQRLNGIISRSALFNRALSDSEQASVNTILNK